MRNIWNHIMSEHGMPKTTYSSTYGRPTAVTIHEKCALHAVNNSHASSSNHPVPQDVSSKNKNLDNNRNQVVRWANNCEYSCGECQKVFKSFKSLLKRHINQIHGLNKAAYMANHGASMTKKSYHSCNICGRRMLHNFSDIVKHMHRSHYKTTIFTYHKMFIEPNEIIKKIIPDCENIFHRIVQDMITTSSTQVQGIKIPVVLLEKYSGFGSKSLDVIEENTKNVKEYLFEDWKKPSQNIKEPCKLCNKPIIRNSTFLRLHIEKKCHQNHNQLTFKEYFEQHIFDEILANMHSHKDKYNISHINIVNNIDETGASITDEFASATAIQQGFDRSESIGSLCISYNSLSIITEQRKS